ncbi:hypothetical protein [Candidatus Phytoplasma pruni]|uniref:hypothetical protein n=1 Tax=Candidatus Phytoplasma pruni TaxID=479893 RepID=UPI0006AC4809|nr:hypothetical protein [Candidatus Phytoplasma pruni]MDW3617860.1 hypothetical protein [Candidatus Phytoplasma pruni]
MYGIPGTSKTTLVRDFAKENNLPFTLEAGSEIANVVNQFKTEMTSFENDPEHPIFIIGATAMITFLTLLRMPSPYNTNLHRYL